MPLKNTPEELWTWQQAVAWVGFDIADPPRNGISRLKSDSDIATAEQAVHELCAAIERGALIPNWSPPPEKFRASIDDPTTILFSKLRIETERTLVGRLKGQINLAGCPFAGLRLKREDVLAEWPQSDDFEPRISFELIAQEVGARSKSSVEQVLARLVRDFWAGRFEGVALSIDGHAMLAQMATGDSPEDNPTLEGDGFETGIDRRWVASTMAADSNSVAYVGDQPDGTDWEVFQWRMLSNLVDLDRYTRHDLAVVRNIAMRLTAAATWTKERFGVEVQGWESEEKQVLSVERPGGGSAPKSSGRGHDDSNLVSEMLDLLKSRGAPNVRQAAISVSHKAGGSTYGDSIIKRLQRKFRKAYPGYQSGQ